MVRSAKRKFERKEQTHPVDEERWLTPARWGEHHPKMALATPSTVPDMELRAPPESFDSGTNRPVRRTGMVLLFLAAISLWFPYPGSVYWQSDDLFALHYSSDLTRALSDFFGVQYGIEGILFYRPLVTMSLWLDGWVGGADPFFAHLNNAVAHGASTVMLACLASRFLPHWSAFFVALVWAAAPGHASSILWAVGRVDSHTTVWVLLAALAAIRWVEHGRGMRVLTVVATALALGTKETALATPGIVFVLALCRSSAPSFLARANTAWRATWPALVVLGLYLVVRRVALGEFVGGYPLPGQPDTLTTVSNTFGAALPWLNPLTYSVLLDDSIPTWVAPAFGYIPVGLALAIAALRKRLAALLPISLLYLGACVPLYPVLPVVDSVMNQRNLYLPATALAALLGVGGVIPCVLALAVFALPFLGIREDFREISVETSAKHSHLIEDADALCSGDEPVFVSGLPVIHPNGTVIAFHLGVDRLMHPPFSRVTPPRAVYALRPLSRMATIYRVPYGDETGLPFGTTLAFDGPETLARLPRRALPPIAVEIDGDLDFTSRRLHEVAQHRTKSTKLRFTNHVAGVSYRITLFSANGYISTILPTNEAGEIDLIWDLMVARFDPADAQVLWIHALCGPTGLDLNTIFPVLVEAGTGGSTPAGPAFTPTGVVPRFLHFEYDAQLASFLSGKEPR